MCGEQLVTKGRAQRIGRTMVRFFAGVALLLKLDTLAMTYSADASRSQSFPYSAKIQRLILYLVVALTMLGFAGAIIETLEYFHGLGTLTR